MAGSTSNTDILKALNQAIQAINDLVLGGDTVVVEAPNVTVRPSITVNCNCGCGGYGGSSQPVIDSDPVDGYPPPSGSAPVDENKCKRVNFLIDQYLDYLWNTERVFTAVSVGPSAGMAAWIAQVPLVFSSLALAGAVVALFWYVATLLVGGLALGLAVLAHKTALENDKANFVCDLYNAGTPADARAVIQQYMSDNLAGLPESWVSYHVDHIFPNNVLNGLFNAWGDDVEAALAAYAGSVDCGGCAGDWYTVNGVPMRDEHAVLQSQWVGGYHYIYVEYTSLGDIEELSFSNYNSFGDGLTYVDSNGVYHRPTVPPSELLPILLKSFGAASSTPFTITIYHWRG